MHNLGVFVELREVDDNVSLQNQRLDESPSLVPPARSLSLCVIRLCPRRFLSKYSNAFAAACAEGGHHTGKSFLSKNSISSAFVCVKNFCANRP